MSSDGIGLFVLLLGDELQPVAEGLGQLSADERAAMAILREEDPATPEILASRIERISALVPVYLPCGHRADVETVVKRIRKGAVLS